MALKVFPPFVLVSARFLLAGTLVLGFARVRELYIPRGREMATNALCGLLLLAISNSLLVFSELLIPSGMAGLIITISPFWMVGVEVLLPGGVPLHLPTLGAMVVALGGSALLLMNDAGSHAVDRHMLIGFLLLQIGMAAWAFGSIYQRRQPGKAHSLIAAGVQQLAAGLVLAPLAIFVPLDPIHWQARGVAALFYLDLLWDMAHITSRWTACRWRFYRFIPM